jgi:S-adenosylmethionine:tRNA ribosyltransferase-isomerase
VSERLAQVEGRNPVRTAEFGYDLPPDLIAQHPSIPRDSSRLMVLHRDGKGFEHRRFRELGEVLREGDLLVANESRVIPARLRARKVPSGGKVELLLLTKRGECTWEALVSGRRVTVGALLSVGRGERKLHGTATAITQSGGRLIEFDEPVEPWLEDVGQVPLPPYIHEPLDDPERYQTVYSRVPGSAAAPTAGLHFTPQLMSALTQKGIEFAFVALDIGLDTFRPVREDRIEDHRMHSERCSLSPQAADQINRAIREHRRVIAVGTTSVRVLESAARCCPLNGLVEAFEGTTDLFIYPGYQFRVVDALITNFHLPHSTLLMLVAAFAGKALIDRAYQQAIQQRYRFYSFGDAMLIQ